MNHWGKILEQAVNDASKVVALGLGLPIDTFSYLAKFGPHLLAPTGSDLTKYGTIGTVLAGFHTDMNLLTIHGKSRFAGLSIWTPSGKKLLVKIPDGCLLIQAGKQMEILTGGKVKAGFHEVTIVPETQSAIAKQIQLNRPLWRISSTLFFHVASDNYLEPLLHFSNKASIKDYPKITAGDQVRKELEFINLAK
jgi:isopenicillin N synthase-like dioxygenase